MLRLLGPRAITLPRSAAGSPSTLRFALRSTQLLPPSASTRAFRAAARRAFNESSAGKQPTPNPYGGAPDFDPRLRLFLRQRAWLSKHKFIRFFVYSGVAVGVVIGSLGVCILGLLAYDATTYSDRHIGQIPVNPIALSPQLGGEKNLPIAQFLLDDEEDEVQRRLESKPKLVVIGGGWGGVGLLKQIDPSKYHIVVIAPENYFAFTPLLPSATVGTVEVRSLVEPLRMIVNRVKGHYLQAKCVDIDMSERLIEVEATHEGKRESFYIPYDKVVIACGATSNTHGVPGMEHCHHLKTVADAQGIRRHILNNLERASLPTVSDTERKKLLSFVVSGGGPTGTEVASEIYDMVCEDMLRYFPKLLHSEFSLSILQSRDHLLNTYSEKISQYAEKRFAKAEINTVLNARVKEVTSDSVTYLDRTTGKDVTIPAGFVLWSTGISMNPLTKTVASRLPNQYHKHALEVDSHLRVKGAPLGTVYAIGDAATVETNLVDHLFELLDKCDTNNDGSIDFEEFEVMTKQIRRKFPTSQVHIEKVRDVFEKYDEDHNNVLGLNELAQLFAEISSRMTSLPATAQVADQQGKYLAKKFSKLAKNLDMLEKNDLHDFDDAIYDPFTYKHLGSLAYLGNSAVFDFGSEKMSFAGGLVAAYLWRSVYWSEQVSMRTRLLLMIDWVKRGIWGRDLSKF